MIDRNRKLKVFVLALAAVGLAVPAAYAKGKPNPTGPGCKPAVSVILKGTITAVDTAPSPDTLTMEVLHANKHGKVLVTKPTATSVTLKLNGPADEGDDTRIRRADADAAVSSLVKGDSVKVHLRVCKADVKGSALDTSDEWKAYFGGTVYPRRVTAHPPKP